MLRPTGNLVIQCTECYATHAIEEGDMEKRSSLFGEGGMGAYVQHERIGEVTCEECGNLMSFRLVGYEYPPDTLEYQDREPRGCKVVEEPSWNAG